MPDRSEYGLPAHPPAPGPVPPWPLTPGQEGEVIARMRGAHVVPGEVPDGVVPPSTSMRAPEQTCDASARAFGRAMPYLGPCVLRYRHDGPVHQDANGARWTDPMPAALSPSAAVGGPHPYVHLVFGPWEASGHQCGDVQPGGCDEPIYERRVTARFNGIGDEHLIGWELRDCPACTPRPDVPDELTAIGAQALRDAAYECVDEDCPLTEQECFLAHPVNWSGMVAGHTHVEGAAEGVAGVVVAAVRPEIERRTREQVAADLQRAAAGRRDYATRAPKDMAAVLEAQADVYDTAARVAETPNDVMWALLPLAMWTEADRRGEPR